MSKTYFLSLLALITLSACSGDNPQQTRYGYNQGVGPGQGRGPNPGGVANNQCHPRVAQDWNHLIASRCNSVNNDRQADACVNGAELFRRKYPNLICTISVADAGWGPGNWQSQSWFEINDSVIYGIFWNYGRNAPGRRGGDWNQPWNNPPQGPNGPNGGFPGDGQPNGF